MGESADSVLHAAGGESANCVVDAAAGAAVLDTTAPAPRDTVTPVAE